MRPSKPKFAAPTIPPGGIQFIQEPHRPIYALICGIPSGEGHLAALDIVFRSRMMTAVRGRDTHPKLLVRPTFNRMGFRFRGHRRDLPGSPDIVLPRFRTCIFVHGCYWHRHPGCRHASLPKTRAEARVSIGGLNHAQGRATLKAVTHNHRTKALAAALLLTCCSGPNLPICNAPPPGLLAWVVDYGFHTEIVVPAAQLNGALAPVRALFPAAHMLSFGFGKASFFTLRDPGLLDFAAGTIPGPADIRVITLRDEPQNLYTTPITRIALAPGEWSQLEGFIAASFARTGSGTLIPIYGNDGTGGRFFAAASGYSLVYTCNAWTVDALHHAGLHVETGALFSGSAMRQVAHVIGACTPR